MNKVILIGNIATEPKSTQTQSGVDCCRLRLAVSRNYARQDGTRESDFINVICWRHTAKYIGQYALKGDKMAVCGTLQNREYTDRDNVRRVVSEVVAEEVTLLGGRRAQAAEPAQELEEVDDPDLPF